MSDINYIGGVVRVLEIPVLQLNSNQIPYSKFRVQLSQLRIKQSKTILTVFVSGNLAQDIVKYYRINDYVLIEGYLSIRRSLFQKQGSQELLQVNVFKIFPLFLNIKKSA